MRVPDLYHCKLAVLNSLGSPASRRVYEYAVDLASRHQATMKRSRKLLLGHCKS